MLKGQISPVSLDFGKYLPLGGVNAWHQIFTLMGKYFPLPVHTEFTHLSKYFPLPVQTDRQTQAEMQTDRQTDGIVYHVRSMGSSSSCVKSQKDGIARAGAGGCAAL